MSKWFFFSYIVEVLRPLYRTESLRGLGMPKSFDVQNVDMKDVQKVKSKEIFVNNLGSTCKRR